MTDNHDYSGVARRINNVVLEDVTLAFRNFEGKEDDYNRAGNRNFSILLRPDDAEGLERDGWNVKYLKAREEGDVPRPYITVTVSYKIRPPKVFMVTSRGKTHLGEQELIMLDWVDIKTCDVILNPSSWSVNGKSGIKAYLQTMFMVIEEDPLEMKYADVHDMNAIEAGPDFDIIEGEVIEPLALER
jgi:hypothetical protein